MHPASCSNYIAMAYLAGHCAKTNMMSLTMVLLLLDMVTIKEEIFDL